MMDNQIEKFIQGKRLAIVGLSRSKEKFGNIAYKELKARGYTVYPVHHEVQEIGGVHCYPNLAALQGQVDGVFVSVPAQKAKSVLQEAASVGIKNIWLQQGSESGELLSLAKQLELNVISGKCLLMYAPPVRGFHGVHRFVMKIVGQL